MMDDEQLRLPPGDFTCPNCRSLSTYQFDTDTKAWACRDCRVVFSPGVEGFTPPLWEEGAS